MAEEISISVKPDQKTFVRFALFDAFVRKRRWVRPALFSAILVAFAAAGLLFSGHAQAPLVGGTLGAVGLGLPAAYFGAYLASVRKKAKALGLDADRTVYTIRLTDKGVSAEAGNEVASYGWTGLHGAWRRRGCVYLYVSADRAFLLPDGQATATPDELWAFVAARLPHDRAHG